MYPHRLIIFLLIMMTISPVQAVDHIKWIYFKDKGLDPLVHDSREMISARSLSRRSKILPKYRRLDNRDAPVNDQYTESLQRMGIRIRHRSRWLNAVSAYMDDSQESIIRSLPFVSDIHPVRAHQRIEVPRRMNYDTDEAGDEKYGMSFTQISQIGVDKLHSLGYSGNSVLICMMDTGFHKDHISLRDCHVVAERDFVFNDNDTQRNPDDPEDYSDSHGTATWSAVGGYDPGELIGPAYGASYILAKTEDLRYEQPIEEDNWIAAVEWADSIGVDVISSSLAYTLFDDGSGYTFEDLDGNTAATTVVADRAAELGIAVIVSAGNYRTTAWGHIGTPADGDSVIAVGAVDANGILGSFSSPGPTADGRIKPEVCARGVGTYCANNASFGYTYKNGTSLSAPLVAGAAALLLEIHPTWTGVDVRSALMRSASRSHNPDNDYGWGIIDAFLASELEALFLEITAVTFDDDSLGGSSGNANGYVETGETVELSVSFRNTGSIHGGSLSGILSSIDDRVFISEPHTILTLGEPGDSAGIETPFVCEIVSNIQGNVDIPLMLSIVRNNTDTVFVSEIALPVHDIVRVAGTVRNIEDSEPVSEAVVSVIGQGLGYVSDDVLSDTNGTFELWLDPDSYSLFALKEGYVGTDRAIWTEEASDITLYLTQPFVSSDPGTILVVTNPDTSYFMPFELRNDSNTPVTVSLQVHSSNSHIMNSSSGRTALRTDRYEGFSPDIASCFGRISPEFMDLIVSFHHPIQLEGTYCLRIGIDTDDNDENGLPVAGYNADYLVEVSDNYMLYKSQSGIWHFESFLSIAQADSSVTVSIPTEALAVNSTVLTMSMEIEDRDNPDRRGDTLPDSPDSYPVSWQIRRPSWVRSDSMFIELAPGSVSEQRLHIDTYGTPTGTYHAELILQGTTTEEQRIPVIAIMDSGPSTVPDNLAIASLYPNPFFNDVDIVVALPRDGHIRTCLMDLAGRSVQEWTSQEYPPGRHWYRLSIDDSVPSGVYLISVTATGNRAIAGPIIRKRHAPSR